ncbi:hypothetical protein [Sphingobacterium rhinopitheci]|uniref:hypothetical protein n=1 Tax=Sphingobacterium rhinopitheci TaxID=2781960 RepID=UPI001F51F848|nr:hypothetical protein [Sphingobacterium rhinopitheci]MCI0921679.1 hypothetical protein [Sphingobacterium rhinopitheci]
MDLTYYLSLTLSALIAAIGTYLFHNKYDKVSPVLASASLTLVITLICHNFTPSNGVPTDQIPYVFIGGSFIGMSTRKKTKTILNISLASLFFSLIYFKSSQFFQGYGGALGLSACISVLIVITSSKLLIRSKHYIRKKRIQ